MASIPTASHGAVISEHDTKALGASSQKRSQDVPQVKLTAANRETVAPGGQVRSFRVHPDRSLDTTTNG